VTRAAVSHDTMHMSTRAMSRDARRMFLAVAPIADLGSFCPECRGRRVRYAPLADRALAYWPGSTLLMSGDVPQNTPTEQVRVRICRSKKKEVLRLSYGTAEQIPSYIRFY
jgi:hypothetical protein